MPGFHLLYRFRNGPPPVDRHWSTRRAAFAATLFADIKSRPAAMIPLAAFGDRCHAATQRVRALPIERAAIPVMQGQYRSQNQSGSLAPAIHLDADSTLQTRPGRPGYSEFRQTWRSRN